MIPSVPPGSVPPLVRATAEKAVDLATKAFGDVAPPASIVWVEPAYMEAHDSLGFVTPMFRPGVVFLLATLSAEDAAFVAAHEYCHLVQYEEGNYTPTQHDPYDRTGQEREANQFAEKLAPFAIACAAHRHELAGRPPAKSGCGCGGSAGKTGVPAFIAAALKIAEAPNPFAGRVARVSEIATYHKAVVSGSKAAAMEAFRRAVENSRVDYERTVCADPKYADSLSMCQQKGGGLNL